MARQSGYNSELKKQRVHLRHCVKSMHHPNSSSLISQQPLHQLSSSCRTLFVSPTALFRLSPFIVCCPRLFIYSSSTIIVFFPLHVIFFCLLPFSHNIPLLTFTFSSLSFYLSTPYLFFARGGDCRI